MKLENKILYDISLSSVWSELLQDNKDLYSKLTTSFPMLTMNSFSANNHSDFQGRDEIFNTQMKVTREGRISGYYCSDTAFNLNHRVLTKIEIKVLEKGLYYPPT